MPFSIIIAGAYLVGIIAASTHSGKVFKNVIRNCHHLALTAQADDLIFPVDLQFQYRLAGPRNQSSARRRTRCTRIYIAVVQRVNGGGWIAIVPAAGQCQVNDNGTLRRGNGKEDNGILSRG